MLCFHFLFLCNLKKYSQQRGNFLLSQGRKWHRKEVKWCFLCWPPQTWGEYTHRAYRGISIPSIRLSSVAPQLLCKHWRWRLSTSTTGLKTRNLINKQKRKVSRGEGERESIYICVTKMFESPLFVLTVLVTAYCIALFHQAHLILIKNSAIWKLPKTSHFLDLFLMVTFKLSTSHLKTMGKYSRLGKLSCIIIIETSSSIY